MYKKCEILRYSDQTERNTEDKIKMKNDKLKTWELALILSVSLTLCQGIAPHWWGVMFPGLSPCQPGQAVAAARFAEPAGGVELRFQIVDWVRELWPF